MYNSPLDLPGFILIPLLLGLLALIFFGEDAAVLAIFLGLPLGLFAEAKITAVMQRFSKKPSTRRSGRRGK